MVVPPNCVTNDPEVATKAWRAWMQEQGLLAQYEQQQRQIAEAAQRAQQEREAVATAQQASAQQAEDESGPARRAETEEIEARYERMLRNTRVMRAAEDQQDLRDQARQQAEIDERAAEMGAENKLNNLETRLSSQRGPLSYSEIASYQNGLGNDLRHLKDSSLENRFQGLMSKATERANQNFDPVTLHSTP